MSESYLLGSALVFIASPLVSSVVDSVSESYLLGSPLVIIACPLVSSVVDSVSESYLLGSPLVFIACPLVSSVVDLLIIMSYPHISSHLLIVVGLIATGATS